VLRVLLARDVADVGYPDFTIEDLHADWATPGLDLERDARVVESGGEPPDPDETTRRGHQRRVGGRDARPLDVPCSRLDR